MGNSSRNAEDKNANKNVANKTAGKVSDLNEDSIGNCTRDHLHYILTKNLCTLCPCPETLCEAEFKSGELINQVGEILR